GGDRPGKRPAAPLARDRAREPSPSPAPRPPRN
ncbi:MAG: hypothetical protein AVDCRST_MAG59-2789, partial [uncultured Thermomicrobiales bacterium]